MKRWTLALMLTAVTAAAAPARVQDRPGAGVARTVLALYDSTSESEPRDTEIHHMVEAPLNHLGLVVRYHDINTGLPSREQMANVRGIVSWFHSDNMPNPRGFLRWAGAAIDSGIKFVILGELSADRDAKGNVTPDAEIAAFWARLGIRHNGTWSRVPYDYRIVHRTPVVEFEREWGSALPGFSQTRLIDSRGESLLKVRRGNDTDSDCDLVILHPNGGYVAVNYLHYFSKPLSQRRWYVNPFVFFRRAFATSTLPKPDTTTLSGRRIFYSHVDGDGWRNITEVPQYRQRHALSAEVILDEVIRAFPDLPVTVAPIAGDIDPAWFGTPASLDLARKILAQPHVEAGSHTYSHPLDWGAAVKIAALQPKTAVVESVRDILPFSLGRLVAAFWDPGSSTAGEKAVTLKKGYETARSYNVRPFSIDAEIRDSIAYIQTLLPAGKKVGVVQWSGDTTPPASVVLASRAAGVRNINGGETKFDEERLSYGWVYPLGRQVGSTWQIYASNSNENNYTELWTNRFFGFRYLTLTLQNTESPIRIKPINVYYHMYSGEKLPSLNALLENLRYSGAQEICPVTTSQFAGVADGFYSAVLEVVGPSAWRLSKRDLLQTLRFDDASALEVDFDRSSGVTGQRLYQGSLYVSLDPADAAPIVALRPARRPRPEAGRPFLIHSRWQIEKVRVEKDGVTFLASGFGKGEAVWQMPKPGRVRVQAQTSGRTWDEVIATDAAGLLSFTVPFRTTGPVQMRLQNSTGERR